MKKNLFILFVLASSFCLSDTAFAVDWSQYESIRANVRLEGYQSMPGYMAFGDGDGNVLGYVWMSPGKGLVWCSATTGTSYPTGNKPASYGGGPGIINLKTTKLTNAYGVPISQEFTGAIADGVKY